MIAFNTHYAPINEYEKLTIKNLFGPEFAHVFTFYDRKENHLLSYWDKDTKCLHLAPEKFVEKGLEMAAYFHEIGHMLFAQQNLFQTNFGCSLDGDDPAYSWFAEIQAVSFECWGSQIVDPVWYQKNASTILNQIAKEEDRFLAISLKNSLDFEMVKKWLEYVVDRISLRRANGTSKETHKIW